MNELAASATRPAGFWIRAAAQVLDAIVIALAQLSFRLVGMQLWGRSVDEAGSFHGLVGLFTVVFSLLYFTVLHATTGQTVGKLLVGVRVVGVDGFLLTGGGAFLRWLGYVASALPLTTGFVMAGLRRDKRALHDLIAGSRVERLPVRRRPVPPPGSYSEATPTGVA